jgi:aldose sugar dehydrogenase
VAFPDVSHELAAGMMASQSLRISCRQVHLRVLHGATNDNRVVRWQVNNALDGVVGDGTILVGIDMGIDHFGCRIRFGPDGDPWVTTGDGAVGAWPQDLNSPAGKVLRVNIDAPRQATPFVGQAADDRIYTFSHRIVQGIAFRPGTGQPYSIEHGSSINDDVNRSIHGGNGGWDPVPGYDGFDGSVPMTDFEKFPDAMNPVWRSGGATFAGMFPDPVSMEGIREPSSSSRSRRTARRG